jgi:hypothetical protein
MTISKMCSRNIRRRPKNTLMCSKRGMKKKSARKKKMEKMKRIKARKRKNGVVRKRRN